MKTLKTYEMKIINKILKNEGGYVYDKNDLGGETYKGISRRYFPNFKGWKIIDSFKSQKDYLISSDLNKLNSSSESISLNKLVFEFYKKEFLDKSKVNDGGIHEDIIYTIIDFGVNIGIKRSIKYAQKASESYPDGIPGPKTRQALKDFSEDDKRTLFLLRFSKLKYNFYLDNIKKRPKNKKYIKGWFNRINRILDETLINLKYIEVLPEMFKDSDCFEEMNKEVKEIKDILDNFYYN